MTEFQDLGPIFAVGLSVLQELTTD